MRQITIAFFILASTIVEAQPETDSNETDYSLYLKNQVHKIVMSSITDTLIAEDKIEFKDYSINFSIDSVIIFESNKRKWIVPITSNFWVVQCYRRERKHGIWIQSEKNGVLVERWKKDQLKTRRWFRY